MAINPQYGMGVYNSRLSTPNISLPQTAGGVATPLAFFPSTQVGDATAGLDTSLQDLIKSQSGNYSGSSNASNTPIVEYQGYAEGFGLGKRASTAVGKGTSIGLSLMGAPPIISNLGGSLAKGFSGKGLTAEEMANLAINTIATALGVPGIALSALNALGFNPAQGIAEMTGITPVTPGYEGGFFGTRGIGSGISGSIGDTGGGTPAGFSTNDLGSGISGGGISYGNGNSNGGSSYNGQTPGYDSGDLGGGITVGDSGGISNSFGDSYSSDSDSDSY